MCLSLAAFQPVTPAASQSAEQAGGAAERARRERDLHDRMQQRRTGHFSVTFEGPEQASLSWAVGAFDGTIRIPMRGALENQRELERILSHEYTHALVRQLSPRPVPVWLNEGLASALEADDVSLARELLRRAGTPILREFQHELNGR
jgi:hypothetical protein